MSSVHSVRVFQGKDEQWYYEAKSANGQVLSTSEGYKRKENAINGLTAEYKGQSYHVAIDEPFLKKGE